MTVLDLRSGKEGPPDEDRPPSLVIKPPSVPVPAGTPFTVAVEADDGQHWFYNQADQEWDSRPVVDYSGGFTIRFDTGEVATTTTSWSVSVTLGRPGIHTATAEAPTRRGSAVKAAAVTFVAGTPSLEVDSPQSGTVIPLAETGADVTLEATTTNVAWFGGLNVTAQADGVSWPLGLVQDGTGTHWRGTVHLGPMPLGTRAITVVAAAQVASQLTGTAVLTLNGVDAGMPRLAVTHPPAGGKVVPGPGMAVQVQGTCSDTQSGMVGGQAAVSVSLSSAGPWAPVSPRAADDLSEWSATVNPSTLGPFAVHLRASDAASNLTDLVWPLEAVSSYVPATLEDRVSDVEYLYAVMVFARDQISTPGGPVTAADFKSTLQQPVDRMSEPLTAASAAGQLPINELRVPVELLRTQIANAAVPADPGQAGEANYLQTAYEALLSAAGTSYSELRLVRGADLETRRAVAARLGIPLYGLPGSTSGRPDQLDALTLLGPQQSTEAELERLFGLPATTVGLDPLRTIARSQLLSWQLEAQSSSWQAEDLHPPTQQAFGVVVDPDVITADDVRLDSPLRAQVVQLLEARSTALVGHEHALQAALETATDPPGKLAALLAVGLPGQAASVLTDWEALEGGGADIAGALAAAGLDRAGYRSLLRLQALTGTKTVVTGIEWATAVQVLVGAYRRRQYLTWRGQESGTVLSPEVFSGARAGPSVSSYRIGSRPRADWLSVLAARSRARENLLEGSAGMVAAAEQTALPILRDALLADIAATVASDAGEFLTGLFQVDFRASGEITTTRLGQATASVQTLLELVRSGDVSPDSPAHSWVLSGPSGTFDTAWSWMGGIDSWRHAVTAFLFPEAAIDPALLDPSTNPTSSASPEFGALASALQLLPGDASPAEVLKQVNEYCLTKSNWLAAAGVPKAGPLSYLSSRNRDHQSRLAEWSAFLEDSGQAANIAAAREIFWAVPMLAGQRLQAAGHYQDALDWLWVVFPYNDPAAVSCSARINREAQNDPAPPDLTFPPNWPSDLNPFHLVEGRPAPYLRNTVLTIIRCLLAYGDAEFAVDDDASLGHARSLYLRAQSLLSHPRFTPVQPAGPGEAALELPQLDILRTRAATQLAKLRQGRNIAGLPRTVIGAPSASNAIHQPTPYHFRVLLARAQQLTQQAGQLEGQYLSLLEKYDAGTLKLSDARFAADLAGLQVKVHDARVQEATDATKAADAQKAKADAVEVEYRTALDAPLNQYEAALLDQYGQLRDLQDVVAVANGAIGIAQAAAGGMDLLKELFSFGAAGVSAATQIAAIGTRVGAEVAINNLQAQMQANQLRAGDETRRQETAIQLASARQDVLVAAAQRTVANDQLTISVAEREVASKQDEQARATLALLSTQFTNPDLYLWMSDTLGGVYRYFLQQATATARLAQAQLAFERAEPAKAFIGADYWKPPQGSRAAAAANSDTKGMTGAERLAEDLSRLDQYAFSTDTRRLNLSQTFSLAQTLPVDFLQFRRTGQFSFATPMAWFDQDFPGHYQRLIRQIHLSLVALISPDRGIRATLSNTGISRVTTPDAFGSFTDVVLRRDPGTVSVTSPLNATGVFDLDLQPDMLLPFEGSGVDTQWQFSLPRAANPFEFSSIADLLLRIDYTALADADYGTLIVRRLNANLDRSSDCVFSLARDFPDQWYELNNPVPPGNSRATTLTLPRNTFPIALDQLATTHLAVGLSARGSDPLPQVQITLGRSIGGATVGGVATTDPNGMASTRRGAAAWSPLAGLDPTGGWQLALNASDSSLFTSGQLEDLVLIVSWHGRAPAWPT